MSADISIDIDLTGLLSPAASDMMVFPSLAQAVQMVAKKAQQIWYGYAEGAPLPDGRVIHPRSGKYARSIKVGPGTDAYSAVVSSDVPYASALEKGQPARDLKRMLNTSPKVRTAKDGHRYLIIPFRHGTPGTGLRQTMSPQVYALARGLTPSREIGTRSVRSGLNASNVATRGPMMVTRRSYRWGGRLSAEQLRAAGARGSALRNQTGMVHMQNPGGRHGQYLTFRVMSERSSGWIAPAIPGYWPARTTADQIRPIAERAFSEAVAADVRAYLGGT